MNELWTIYEPKSGRYFKATFDDVMKMIESLNKKIESGDMKWNDIFRAFGLPEVMLGELIFDRAKLNSHLDFGIETDDFAPVIVIDYI